MSFESLPHFGGSQQGGAGGVRPVIVPVARAAGVGRWVASLTQEQIYLRNEVCGHAGSGVSPWAVRLRGRLEVPALRAALADLGRRHEGLRTGFVFDPARGPVQVVRPVGQAVVELAVGEVLPHEVPARIARACARPMDLAVAPLLRAELWEVRECVVRGAECGGGEWILLLCVHRIVADERSVEILGRDLAVAYRARVEGVRPGWAVLPVGPVDVAVREHERLAGPALAEQVAYWDARLGGATPVLLPTDRLRTPSRSGRGASVPVEWDAGTVGALRGLAEAEGGGVFAAVFAALAVVLGRWSSRSDVVVGTPVSGRGAGELDDVVGHFGRVLPLRVEVGGGVTLREVVRRAVAVCAESFSRAEAVAAPLGAGDGRSGPRPALVRALLTLREPAVAAPRWPGLEVEFLAQPRAAEHTEVSVELSPAAGGGLVGSLVYAAELFDQDTARRLVESLYAVCGAMVADPEGSAAPSLVSREQYELVTARFSGASAARGVVPAYAHAWFEERVDKAPERVAVVTDRGPSDAAGTLSYGELEERSNQVAWWLRGRGVGAEGRVGVHLERGVDLVVVLLGVFKAGATYVPLDPQSPPERLGHVLRDAAPALCVTGTERGARELRELGGGVVVSVAAEREAWASQPVGRPVEAPPGAGAAYVVYTSGSTGAPKGVVVTHGGLANQLGWLCEGLGFGPDDVILHKTPLAADRSLWELLVPLMCGGRLVLAEPCQQGDPAYLLGVHERHGVTACDFFPSLLRHFLAEPGVAERARRLRTVLCGGEELNAELARRFAAALPGARLYHLYGPAEATIAVTFCRVPAGVCEPIPIGVPVPGAEVYVLDEFGRPQPIGVPGEVFLAGVQLARGYLGRPGWTADRFVPHPFRAGERLYRTGDRARWRSEGSLEFLGRLEDRVQIRGCRVDPAEVEAALVAHPGVGQALVLARPAPEGGPRLVGYLTRSRPGPAVDTASLRRVLAGQLPAGMIPSAFVWLDSFPLTAVGKVDRAALPDPAAGRRRTAVEAVGSGGRGAG